MIKPLRNTTLFFFLLLVASPLEAQSDRSVLADGDIFKIATRANGVYKLDFNTLEQLGINPTTIDPRQIQLFGHGGGFLPEANSEPRIDDLEELSIVVQGEEDGSFDAADYVLFYGESADQWERLGNGRYHMTKNPYETRNYYFVRVGAEIGRRVTAQDNLGQADYETDSYLDYQHYEVEQHNLLHASGNANLQGSGRRWLGDIFKGERAKDFSPFFDFTGLVTAEPVYVHMEFVARSSETSSVTLSVNGQDIRQSIARATVDNIEEDYAKTGVIKEELTLMTAEADVQISYPSLSNNNEGWLDFIEFNLRRALSYRSGAQLHYTEPRAMDYQSIGFRVANVTSSTKIWNVTNPLQPLDVESDRQGDVAIHRSVVLETPSYVAFDEADALVPEVLGRIANQNLHGIGDVEYLMIYHPDFEAAAQKLADHRRSFGNLSVAMASVDQVFNEFSSGKVDPTAIRDLVKRIYDHSQDLKYLILIGDGSFDYKHIYDNLNDESFIPVYETKNSYHPITAFPYDDYYALLDDREGGDHRGAIDIAVGRLPVRTAEEANLVVEKIINYETSDKTLGDWRTNVLFVADDEDGNRHLRNADLIAEDVRRLHPSFNINKVYLDAYEQENTPGGIFNFNATEALNQSLFKGQLVVNYLGHGGSRGWAQERVLQKGDVDKWSNKDRLPLLITATCSFAGYDNPQEITAGEYTLTNPTGGAIALFTTVRAVYAGSNERLTRNVFDHLFEPVNGQVPPIGEILRTAKNSSSADTTGLNARKFTLLGDPAMYLALPSYSARTLRINGKSVDDPAIDTLKALSKIRVEGEIIDANGQLVPSYNGEISPTIFDKSSTLKTLAQDKGSSEQEFSLQKSVIFKGLASVTNGKFEFSFVVPKDINYVYGNGKISYYAKDGSVLDAAGAFDGIVVGGTSDNALDDTEGPEIEIFLDDENFVFGGLTGRDPVLLVRLKDENGINVIGNSIGHDLTALFDNNPQSTAVLNDFYESEKDDFTSGLVTYPLSQLEVGKHTVEIKAWDIANNSSVSYSEFVVVDEETAALQHVLNYPNPFSTNTCFQFEHPFQGQDIDIRVEIMTVSGRLVKTLEKRIKASGKLSRDVKWDGMDDFGDPLANGIYVYRVTVEPTDFSNKDLKNRSDLEKLVILR